MEWVVVEREFDPPLTREAVLAQAEDPGCMALYGVTPIRSYLAPGGKRMICVFRAPDAEALRSVFRTMPSPEAKVWTSTVHKP